MAVTTSLAKSLEVYYSKKLLNGMAISTTGNPSIQRLALKFGFDEIRMYFDPASLSYVVEARYKGNQLQAQVADVDLSKSSNSGILDSVLRQMAQKLNVQRPTLSNELDIRANAVEGLADFIALLEKRHEQTPERCDTVIITPEQKNTLLAALPQDVSITVDPDDNVMLYGCKLLVEAPVKWQQ